MAGKFFTLEIDPCCRLKYTDCATGEFDMYDTFSEVHPEGTAYLNSTDGQQVAITQSTLVPCPDDWLQFVDELTAQLSECKAALGGGSTDDGTQPTPADKTPTEKVCFYPTEQENMPPHKRDYTHAQEWYSQAGGFCYTNVGEAPLPDGSNLITTTNLTMNKETRLGQLTTESRLVANEFNYDADGIVICLDDSVQDVVAAVKSTQQYADFIAAMEAKFPLPAGAAYGLSKLSVEQFDGTPKRNVYCDIAGAVQAIDKNTQVEVVGLTNTSLLTVGGLKPYGKPLAPIEVVDTDGSCHVCNDVACELVDGDVTVKGAVGNAVQVDFCVTCFATPAK